jgi:hypothetical protein
MMLGWQNSSHSAFNFQFAEPSGIGSEDSVEGGGVDAEGSGDLRNDLVKRECEAWQGRIETTL